MKIKFNKQILTEAITPLMYAVSGKATLSSIEGILIDAYDTNEVVLTTYDLEKGLRTTIEAEVSEPGCYILSAQKFNQTIRVMNGSDITVTVSDKLIATITCGKAFHRMTALEGKDFPTIPTLESEMNFKLGSAVLKKIINKVSYAMGVNDKRAVLNGCYFHIEENKMLLVACDSFRLAVCETSTEIERLEGGIDVDYTFIVPNKCINDIERMLSDDENETVTVFMMRKHFVLHIGNYILFSRLIEGQYIDYERIIVKNHNISITVSRDELYGALERASVVTEEKSAGTIASHVILNVKENIIEITSKSAAGNTYDEISCEHEGADIRIAFTNKYFIETVKSCDCKRLTLSLVSPLMGMNIVPLREEETPDSELYLLLPVRIKE